MEYRISYELLEELKDGRFYKISSIHEWEERKKEIISGFVQTAGRVLHNKNIKTTCFDVISQEDIGHSVRKEIRYKTIDEDSIRAYLIIPKKAKHEKIPAVLCLHQTNGTLGCEEPAGISGIQSLFYGLELAQKGYITLMPDYPYMGKNNVDVYSLGYESATMKGIINHMAAVDILESLDETELQNDIGCIGHSLGGHNSVFLTLLDQRISVCVSSSGICSFDEYAKANGTDLRNWASSKYMPLIREKFFNDPRKMPWDFTGIIGCIAPRPVFLNAPKYDTNMTHAGHMKIINAAMPVYDLYGSKDNLKWEEPDAEHSFPDHVRQIAYEFIDRHMMNYSSKKQF